MVPVSIPNLTKDYFDERLAWLGLMCQVPTKGPSTQVGMSQEPEPPPVVTCKH
jgi:hypothetical protein